MSVPGGTWMIRSSPLIAGHLFPHAPFAALGGPVVPAGEVEQGVFVGVGDHDDAAAVAAIAAVGSALGDVLFAAEGDAPVPAVAGLHANCCFIDEHGLVLPAL